MGGHDLKEAAERMARRREILKQQVPMKPNAPENIKLSKAEFIAKRRHEKEEDIAVENFKKDFRAKKISEAEPKEEIDGSKKEEVKEEKLAKRGRPKKVE